MYHKGELAVQEQAGVKEMAARIAKSIRSFIPQAAKEFLSDQSFAIVASVDSNGKIWASLVKGKRGFIETVNDQTIRMIAQPVEGDPLIENLKTNPDIGMIAIEFETKRRIRINGDAQAGADGAIYIRTNQVYSNCPKYIHVRNWKPEVERARSGLNVQRSKSLLPDQIQLIESSNTFFIASHHVEGGADASHRGGEPGFVRLKNHDTLVFPDYSGNTMFQTLGNLTENPNCGLLFIDFERNLTLQLSGTAQIIWDPERIKEFDGAQRIVEFKITEVISTIR